jgi:hypothetical protein
MKHKHTALFITLGVVAVGGVALILLRANKANPNTSKNPLPPAPTVTDYAKYISGWTGTGFEQYLSFDVGYLQAWATALGNKQATFTYGGKSYNANSGKAVVAGGATTSGLSWSDIVNGNWSV